MLAVNAENHGNNKHVILPNKKYESFFVDSYFFVLLLRQFMAERRSFLMKRTFLFTSEWRQRV